eukprot:IDg20250t1
MIGPGRVQPHEMALGPDARAWLRLGQGLVDVFHNSAICERRIRIILDARSSNSIQTTTRQRRAPPLTF